MAKTEPLWIDPYLGWELEKLVRRGWTDEEILAAAKVRVRKPRGRPRITDNVEGIVVGKATAGKIAGGNDSLRRRLSSKTQEAVALDRYCALIEELVRLCSGVEIPWAIVLSEPLPQPVHVDIMRVHFAQGLTPPLRTSATRTGLGRPWIVHDRVDEEEARERETFILNLLSSNSLSSHISKKTMASLEQILCKIRAKAGEKSK